ncbi:hypothetical protein ACFFMN_16020 [Planobispora siamensis]|uniref:Uncharacterized protein n=1 Tax=Planobispora siamensis TaxID=936338 RepID=A0A8J3WKA2_9ACTN|nr:hypothetical protein [Planobispora siamensis]GIH93874.1 hypothetical protein Psi01_45040 [Planobispora siamensis]
MGEWFTAAWAQGLEVWEAARRMGVTVADVDDSADRTWQALPKGPAPGQESAVLWAGRLTGDWIQIIQLGGHGCAGAVQELSYGGRAFAVSWHFNHPGELHYAVNGRDTAGFTLSGPAERWGDALDPYTEGLLLDVQDSDWENDPELPPGLREYLAWEEARVESGEEYEDVAIPEEWRDLAGLAHAGYSPAEAEGRSSLLTLVGRMTGREFDREWMAGKHTRYLLREPG